MQRSPGMLLLLLFFFGGKQLGIILPERKYETVSASVQWAERIMRKVDGGCGQE
jgi:hypothetical protein